MNNEQMISDLKMMLQAVQQMRTNWLSFVAIKFQEACNTQKPATPEAERALYNKILTSSDVNQEYQKLVTLYGCIGSQSEQYINALNSLEKAA